MSSDSLAILHEHYPVRGGAEHVVEEMARTFDNAPIYTGFAREECLPDDPDLTVHELFGDKPGYSLLWRKNKYAFFARLFASQQWFSQLPELVDYDAVITSGIYSGFYVPPEDQALINYCHTPPRLRYDLFSTGEDGTGLVMKAHALFARAMYQPNLNYPDQWVANSELVRRRMVRYWGLDEDEIEVIYPPVHTETFGNCDAPVGFGDYYLSLGRLGTLKRTGMIVEAFKHTDKQLIIAGTGGEEEALKRQAKGHDNIKFLGYVDDEMKRKLLAGAKALVFAARNEDFGMVPVEAMASGTPVIGVDEGYTRFQVEDRWNGLLFEDTVPALHDAVSKFERDGVDASPEQLKADAERYSLSRFQREMREVVDRAKDKAQISMPERRRVTVEAIADGGQNE